MTSNNEQCRICEQEIREKVLCVLKQYTGVISTVEMVSGVLMCIIGFGICVGIRKFSIWFYGFLPLHAYIPDTVALVLFACIAAVIFIVWLLQQITKISAMS